MAIRAIDSAGKGVGPPRWPFTEALLTRLRAFPQLEIWREEGRIEIPPSHEGGFPIVSEEGVGGITLHLEGWFAHIGVIAEAEEWVLFALSRECRLRVELRGARAYAWTVEERDGAAWKAIAGVRRRCWAFWRRATVVYLQNDAQSAA